MSRSELNLIDFYEEIKMTLANYADFKENVTHEVYDSSLSNLQAKCINITKNEEVDLVIGLFTLSVGLYNDVDFTMQIISEPAYLFIRPIERYVTDYGWFLKVNN